MPPPYPIAHICSLCLSSQFVNSASFLVGQSCADTSYGPAATTPSFLPKSDFPQVGHSSLSNPSSPQ